MTEKTAYIDAHRAEFEVEPKHRGIQPASFLPAGREARRVR
ncbi:hypothetical protein FM112_00030 [Gulosibacter sp. 10]|nr:hypothetical protein FM112_00030 [Gulosibacter sp. 10]